MYLTSSIKQVVLFWCRYKTGIWYFFTTPATRKIWYFSYNSFPLSSYFCPWQSSEAVKWPIVSCQLTEKGKGRKWQIWNFSQFFKSTLLCLACVLTQGHRGWQELWHRPRLPPRPLQSLELIPLHSTAPHSCSLILEPLTGVHTTHKKPLTDCSLQDVLADSTHTQSQMALGLPFGSPDSESPSCMPNNKILFSSLISCIRANPNTRLT